MSSRLKIILLIFLLIFLAAAGRLFFLQIVKGERYEEAAKNQQVLETSIEPKRGSIFLKLVVNDKERYVPAAITKRWWDVWVSPKEIEKEGVDELPAVLAEILSLDQELVAERLNKENDPYEPLKQKVDDETIEKLNGLKVKGLYWREDDDRFYPLDDLAAPLIGFLGQQGHGQVGQYGLEEFYDDILSGESGYIKGFKNPFGFLIRPFAQVAKPDDGANLYLTIDYNIQLFLEKKLKEAQEELSAKKASGIVMDPKTGAILALASVPAFNPNEYNKVEDISLFLNPNIQELYEPGSVFKPITMAVGLDINVIASDLTYYDKGFVEVSDATIQNSTGQSYGTQTMTQVLEKSLNTGAVFVVKRIPSGVWREYLEKFGLDERSGIDLVGELEGNIRNIRSGREVEIATSAFGQGIAITPLALLRVIAAIANKGKMVAPYIVEKVVYADGKEDVIEGPKLEEQVIAESTAETVSKMMVSVVENGSGRRAQVAGYFVAGKTGTAQVPSPEGGYLLDETIHSFVGFAPAYDPAFVAIIKIDNPRGVSFSELSVAPIFGELAEFILHYYEIEPDKPLIK